MARPASRSSASSSSRCGRSGRAARAWPTGWTRCAHEDDRAPDGRRGAECPAGRGQHRRRVRDPRTSTPRQERGRARARHRSRRGDPSIHDDLRRDAHRRASPDRAGCLDPRGQRHRRRRFGWDARVARVRQPDRLARARAYRLLPRAHADRRRRVPRATRGLHRRSAPAVPRLSRLREGWRGPSPRPHRREQHDPAGCRDRRGRARGGRKRRAPRGAGADGLGRESGRTAQRRHPRSRVLRRHLPACLRVAQGPPRAGEKGDGNTMTAVATQEIPLVDLKAQYATIRDEVRAAIDEVLESMQLTIGPNVKAFDQEFASYIGTKHSIGVGSGTDALQLAIRALGISSGDEVITVSHTFFATVEAILYSGARPILVDVDEKTFNMDFAAAAQAITPRTKAIIPVHLYGRTVDLKPLRQIAQDRNIMIIEDAAQAHGALLDDGKKAG